MISMVLGLLVVGAAIGIFLSNRQAYAATEGVGRIQETARLGFELIARDIREAGANPCDKALPVANVLTAPTATWWKNWAQPLQGYEDGALAGSSAGTDAVQILEAATGGATVNTHIAATQILTLSASALELQSGNVALLCDRQQLAIFQMQTVSGTSVNYSSASQNACNRFGRLPGVCRASAWRAQTAIHMKETPSSPIFAQFVGTLKRRQGGGVPYTKMWLVRMGSYQAMRWLKMFPIWRLST